MLQGEHSTILLTFIKLPFVIKIFVFEWLFYTGFTVFKTLYVYCQVVLEDQKSRDMLKFDYSAWVGEVGGDIRKELPYVAPGKDYSQGNTWRKLFWIIPKVPIN